jgi:hypothetical protein
MATLPLSIASTNITIAQANTSTNGYLSSTDWNTFNSKQNAQDAVTLTNSPGTYDYLTILGQAITLNQINLTTDVTGTLPVGNGGTGLTAYGTANQIMGMNATGTALEYKTINGTTNQITVTNAANSLTLSLPQNIHTAATPTFGGVTLTGTTGVLKATAGVISGSATTTDLT